jgi:hypothetical protein
MPPRGYCVTVKAPEPNRRDHGLGGPAVDEAFCSCMLGLSHRVGAAESADNVGGSSVRHLAGRTRAGPPQAGRMCVHQEPRTVHGSP